MKITKDQLEISDTESISWNDVDNIRISGSKLALVMTSGKVIELEHLRPTTIDSAFRAFELFLAEHPERRKAHRKNM